MVKVNYPQNENGDYIGYMTKERFTQIARELFGTDIFNQALASALGVISSGISRMRCGQRPVSKQVATSMETMYLLYRNGIAIPRTVPPAALFKANEENASAILYGYRSPVAASMEVGAPVPDANDQWGRVGGKPTGLQMQNRINAFRDVKAYERDIQALMTRQVREAAHGDNASH